jgi:hypothetical protein
MLGILLIDSCEGKRIRPENNPTAPCEVWRNLIILHAATPNEALRRAETIGRSDAGDPRGSLRLVSPAVSVFGALYQLRKGIRG